MSWVARSRAPLCPVKVLPWPADWLEWFSITAMRPRETSTLSWGDYTKRDDGYATLTVRVENAKIRESREVPIVGPLEAIIERRIARKRIDSPLVFHANGRSFEHPSGGLPERFLRIWHRAVEAVGYPMLAPADPKQKSASMFRRYAIVDSTDAANAFRSVGEYVSAQKGKRSKLLASAARFGTAGGSEHGQNTDKRARD
jgi:integrase